MTKKEKTHMKNRKIISVIKKSIIYVLTIITFVSLSFLKLKLLGLIIAANSFVFI